MFFGGAKLQKEFSIYLDLVRFIAAVLVVIYHSNLRYIIADIVPASDYAHSAVMVFFVLSGYVIAYITETKENTPRKYWISRAARIYSVAIPALILTLLVDNVGEAFQPSFYEGRTTHDYWLLRIATSMLFLNEVWSISIMAFSNIAYWSLNYEIWYYVLFAIVFFSTGRRRLALVLMVCLLLGPKILLLAPIWWLGVFLHRSELLKRISEPVGWLLFIGSLLLLWHFHELELESNLSLWLKTQIGAELHKELTFSRFFLSDYILAPIVLMNFAGFRAIAHRFAKPALLAEKPIRFLAGYTFSLYLFHQPLILFFAALFDGDPDGYLFYTQVMLGVFLTVLVLGHFTEKKKYVFRRLVEQTFDTISQIPTLARFRPSGDLVESIQNRTRNRR